MKSEQAVLPNPCLEEEEKTVSRKLLYSCTFHCVALLFGLYLLSVLVRQKGEGAGTSGINVGAWLVRMF